MRWLAVTCLLAVGLLTTAAASSSPVHYPASNGWIVFASDRDINSGAPFRLYRLEPIGGGVEPLGSSAAASRCGRRTGLSLHSSMRGSGSSLQAQTGSGARR